MNCGGIFDIDVKVKRLQELEQSAMNPEVWNKPQAMQKINQEKAFLQKAVDDWKSLNSKVEDCQVLLEMAVDAKDEATFEEVKTELNSMSEKLNALELKSLLTGEMDSKSAYLSINAGAGGTEACDWASLLLRMYTRWAEKEGYTVEVMDISEAEEAGVKSATLLIQGPYVYGHLRSEVGVHRLVRISPFDSNARRHTSFASVFAWPEIDDEVNIEIRDEDLRVDTYRSSGAGGQHVNKTDSAIRITHIPTNIVVSCQTQRSQHENRSKAMKMLKAALYELEMEKRKKEMDQLTGSKLANEWGSQIRSYVLHPYQLVKDHRTDFESSNPESILDGGLNEFIRSYLKEMVLQGQAAKGTH